MVRIMKKPELLCPAGNMESLKAAIHNGADAVYLAGKHFGARKFAENFNNDDIVKAIKYAHLYDVKVYITANTLIYENEVNDFIEYINFLYLNGVDAVLMQDIGMISLVRKIIPDLEIHASTQTHNCNDETLALFKKMGVKRVVLARELTINQIDNLKTDIEKEVFIHGALCICYSGCCLFSSLNGGRSGNRGQCAGPCRLPYTLIKDGKPVKTDGKFLLSTRELNTSLKIKDILKSNIQSLKIEGRMKSPEYVAFVTKMYRQLIDDNYLDNNADENLKKLFNREFTEGHLFKNENDKLMNIKSPNHIGVSIGKVISINKQIKIKLEKNLNQNDGIRFKESNKGMIINKLYNEKGLLINKASKGDIIYLDNKINLKTTDEVLKTTDYLLEESLKKYETKKLPLDIEIKAFIDSPLIITFSHQNYKFSIKGKLIQKSINSPISKEQIQERLSKLGNTPFTLSNITIEMDNNIFIPVKELNEIRRQLVDKIIEEKTKVNRNLPNIKIKNKFVKQYLPVKISAFVSNEKQLITLLPLVDKIYTDDHNLYLKYQMENVFLRTNRTAYDLPNFIKEKLLITNLGDLYKYPNTNNTIADYFLNITNSYSSNFLLENGVNTITISPELSLNQIKDIASKTNNIEIIIYGTLEIMVLNHCLIKSNDQCPNCKNNKYFLKNMQNNLYPIISKNCQTHILNHEKINLLHQIEYLKNIGITNFRLEFFDESNEEILEIIKQIKK